MFSEKKEKEKLHKGSVLAGYDLGEKYSQISYLLYGEEEPDTVATVVGTKQYNIPTMLCKRAGTNQWLYGKDAVKCAGDEDMIPVDGLLSLARKGEQVELDGESYDPVALLTLFLKRSLTLMNLIAPVDRIDAIMFTVDAPDDRMVEILSRVTANLGLKTKRIYFQGHTESFYYFMLHQPAELWHYQVIACEHDGTRLKTYRMECNRKTTPVVVLIDEQVCETLVVPDENEEETVREDAYRLADERLLGILQEMCRGRIVSSAYLLGDGFKGEWQKESLQFLCRNRRVFQGNNLFSKGACYGLLERLEPGEIGSGHVFLGRDKLKSNIGMHVLRRGKESYYALLDAGENWYDVEKRCEILLTGERKLAFVITPLTGRNAETREMTLTGAGSDGAPYTKYRLEMEMSAPETVHVTVTDLGFGDFYPASGQVWKETLELP